MPRSSSRQRRYLDDGEYNAKNDFSDRTKSSNVGSEDSIESVHRPSANTTQVGFTRQGAQRPNRDVNRVWIKREDRPRE